MKALKKWPAWVLLVFVVVAFLAVGATRDDGPSTPQERSDAIAQRVACPVCDGESVFESRNTASVNIRNRISELVNGGQASDDEIIADIEASFGGRILLVPKATGFDALVWALPVAALDLRRCRAGGDVPQVAPRCSSGLRPDGGGPAPWWPPRWLMKIRERDGERRSPRRAGGRASVPAAFPA